MKRFPVGFLWGAATSAHQVEGEQNNDWSEWEQSPARLTNLGRRGLIQKYGKENFISGIACDHYHRYAEDFSLARSLGHTATRFSVEWSRIEPKEGRFDDAALEHYRAVLRSAHENGLEPFVTLWHWTIPLWFRDLGGWTNPRAPDYFARYVGRVIAALGEDVRLWITLNEPEIVAASYLAGRFPPQHRNFFSYLRVIRNLIHSHRRAYCVIKKRFPDAQIGIAHNVNDFEAAGRNPWNGLLKRLADWWVNDYFFDRLAATQDFLGCNYYFHNRINWGLNQNTNPRISDIGWALFPEGIKRALLRLHGRYKKPIYITENG
ncbi:MAG: family 1 glycosylhydrolase, partial [bacterium]